MPEGGRAARADCPPERSADAAGPARLRLLVIGEERFFRHPLPDRGRVVVGRGAGCDLRIDDSSIALQHVAFLVGEDEVHVEDLGSGLATCISEKPLAEGGQAKLKPGELVRVGGVLLMVEARPGEPPRRLLPHDYFELRLEEECLRADRRQTQFTLLRVCTEGAEATLVEEVLASSLRLLDVVASYGPGEYQVLLVDTPVADTSIVVERLLGRLQVAAAQPRVGVARFPADGRNADVLSARARAEALGEGAPDAVPEAADFAGSPMEGLQRMVERVAPSDISVLIFGETGVGKERLAQAVHRSSLRAAHPFVELNCAALTESLLESELFGHERGSFTGAIQSKPGLLETADGGTVFLDEIGDMPLSIQVKLLRVLEERKVLRVGGLKPKAIDVRFVAATNRDLEAEVARGHFRQDLFFRLNGISFVIPPLRERRSELRGLTRFFLEDACRRFGKPNPPQVSAEVSALFETYPWPGNIRELRNVVERAVLLAGAGPIRVTHLPAGKMTAAFANRRLAAPRTPGHALAVPELAPAHPYGHGAPEGTWLSAAPAPAAQPAPAPPREGAGGMLGGLRSEVEAYERARIAAALAECAGNQTEAARRLGVSRRTLVKRLAAYDLPRPRKPRQPR